MRENPMAPLRLMSLLTAALLLALAGCSKSPNGESAQTSAADELAGIFPIEGFNRYCTLG